MKKLSRQAFVMSTLTMLLVWGNMLYFPILVPKFWWEYGAKICKGWGGTRGSTHEIGILTTGKTLCQNWMWVVKMEVRGRKAPLWNILTNQRMRIFVPPFRQSFCALSMNLPLVNSLITLINISSGNQHILCTKKSITFLARSTG